MKTFFNERGLTLIEGVMCAAILGGVALGFAELSKNSSGNAQSLESRYTKMDVEQSIRSAFMSYDSCRCAFSGVTINVGSTPTLSELRFTDATCGNARTIVTSGQNVSNSTLKVESISVRNIATFSPVERVGDLVIDWKNPGKGPSIKPSLMRNLRFNVTAAGVVNGCGFIPELSTPEECGNGKICIGGKQVQFFNDPAYGAPLSAISQGIDTDGWLAVKLQAPSGRFTMLKFKEISGLLKYQVPHQNWRPQLCWYHFLSDPCYFFTGLGSNCASAIYWKYLNGSGEVAQDGNTASSSLRVPNPAAPGEKPYIACP